MEWAYLQIASLILIVGVAVYIGFADSRLSSVKD